MEKLITLPNHGLSALMPKETVVPVEQKGLMMTYGASSFWDANLNPWTRGDDVIRGLSAYRLFWLAYSCMSYRATKLQEAPLWIREEKQGEEVWIRGAHPLAKLLEEPNPDMEMSDLIETISLYLDGTGACLLTKRRNKGQQVAQLWPFPKDAFSVEPADGKLFGKYRVQTNRGQKDFAPEDVIHLRNFDPSDLLGAMSPLEAALSHVNIGNSLKNAVIAQLKNKIAPGAVVSYPQTVEDDEFDRFKAEMSASYAGVRNHGKTMVVDAGGKVDILSGSLKDLEMGAVDGNVEVAVCAAFKVHPLIVGTRIGLEASSGFADTLEPATRLFYDVAAIPAWTRIERALTRGLLREIDPNPLRFIRFDTSRVRALQADLGKKTVEAGAAGKYWTVNERRVHTGQPPLPEDDPRGEAFDVASFPLAGANITDGGDNGDDPEKNRPTLYVISGKSLARASKMDARKRLWRRFDAKARKSEDDYKKAALAQFMKEKGEVLKLLRASGDNVITGALEAMKKNYRRGGEYYLEWIERYEKLISRSMDLAGGDLAAEIGFDFDLNNPAVQLEIRNRVNKLAGNVTRTTYASIKNEVSAGTRDGEGISVIAKRIQEVFSSSEERATLIARTETIGALNAGEQIAARESGLDLSKEWLTQGDDRVRDSHAELDGVKVKLDEPFANGLQHPGDQRGTPDEICNCRCGVLYHDEVGE
jgi:HK97 family phage portal protein